jgi:hypothetical protein
MESGGRRSGIEVERIVSDFERSGLSRRAYCERHGIAVQTLDWYRRRVRASGDSVKLVPVRVENRSTPIVPASAPRQGFALRARQQAAHRERPEFRRQPALSNHSHRRCRIMFGLGRQRRFTSRSNRWTCAKASKSAWPDAQPSGRRSAERPSVPVRQPRAHAPESSGLGWQRPVGLRQATGARQLPLAEAKARLRTAW